jgi:hypothetical protein
MSHASRTPRRPSRARRAALVLVAVLALGACSHNRQVPDSYGDTTQRNFTEGCEEALTETEGAGDALTADEAEAVCQCSYDAISDPDDGVPYEQFKEINDELEDEPGPLPDVIAGHVEGCRGEAGPA